MAATIQTSLFQDNNFSIGNPVLGFHKTQYNVEFAYNYGSQNNKKNARLIIETPWINNKISFATSNMGTPIITVALDKSQESCNELTAVLDNIANCQTGVNKKLFSIIDEIPVSNYLKNDAKELYKKKPIKFIKCPPDGNPNIYPLVNFKFLTEYDNNSNILTQFRHQSFNQNSLVELPINSFDDIKNNLVYGCDYRLIIALDRITINKSNLKVGTRFVILRVDIKAPIKNNYPMSCLPKLVAFHEEKESPIIELNKIEIGIDEFLDYEEPTADL